MKVRQTFLILFTIQLGCDEGDAKDYTKGYAKGGTKCRAETEDSESDEPPTEPAKPTRGH